MRRPFLLLAALLAALCGSATAEIFRFPTANRALLEQGGGERFFVPTVGKPWTSGMFGCVRSEGHQLHEGLDIKCLQRDRRNEPTDPVMASADGAVAYINHKPGLSNYGNYVVLKHNIEGLEVYTIYAHLSEFAAGLSTGKAVRAGEVIATMGRTANTKQGISKDRAHVHFEINLLINERFAEWYAQAFPGQRNDHGDWNGQNLVGLDPRLILLQQAEQGANFSLRKYIHQQVEMCRVFVRDNRFPWLKRYHALVQPNPIAEKEGVAGYELVLNFNGIPFQVIPRAAREVPGNSKRILLSVNDKEAEEHPCRHLVVRRAGKWDFGATGNRFLDLLTY